MPHISQRISQLVSGFTLIFLLCFSVSAQTIVDDNLRNSKSLRADAELFLAGQEVYTADQIVDIYTKGSFKPMTDFNENLGFSEDNYWVRFALTNATETSVSYYLETGRPITDLVTLYINDGSGKMVSHVSGDAIPFLEKDVLHRKSVFRIGMMPGQTLEGYVHLKSDGEVVMLPLDLIPEKIFLYETYREQLFYGFFYGILILACIIYLFFYSAMRDTAFVYYSLYVIAVAMLQFSLDGLFHQYIMPSGGYFSKRAVLFSALISMFFFVNYSRKFLDIQQYSAKLLFAFKAMSNISLIGIVALKIVPQSLVYCYPLANHIGLITLLLVIGSVIFLKTKKVKVDYFFISGISFLILGFVIFILNNLNLVPNSFITENGAKLGIGLEIIFLSLSMGNRIRNLRRTSEENQVLALQRLEDMNDMKSSFISNISHELRTPLNLIMGVADTLRADQIDKDLRDKCTLILTSSETLLNHVDDIIDFTSIEKGEQELHKDVFNLPTLIDRIVNLNRKKAEQKSLDFLYTYQDGLPQTIIGDKRKLIQILNNLLDNAVKFTAVGEIKLHIDYTFKEDGNVALTFKVSDTGIGISKEKMSTIYESFTKKSSADKREFYGLGLGLYVVKSYIDLQDGHITIKNGSKIGTTCQVDLDFEVQQESVVDITDIQKEDFDFEGCRILLVEDNKMNQLVIKMAAKKWGGVDLQIANHGVEAIDMLQTATYDVILMDLQMPVMDGFETTANIRAGKAGQSLTEIPIIVVTADATDTTKKEIFRLGANDYMTKPIKADVLVSKIRENLMAVAK